MAAGSISNALSLVIPNIAIDSSLTYFFATSMPSYAVGPTDYYADPQSPYSYDVDDMFGLGINSNLAFAASAFARVSAVSDVSFSSDNSEAADIVVFGLDRPLFTASKEEIYAFAYTPGHSANDLRQDIVLAKAGINDFDVTLAHEIMHVLGVTDAKGILSAQTTEDSARFTITSYNPHPGYGRFATELQLYDIAAIQHLYGANHNHESGDTVYNQFAETSGPHLGKDRMFSIWDGDGTDIISASAMQTPALIDLRPGHFSSIGPESTVNIAVGGSADVTVVNPGLLNVSVAFGSYIENATGTSSGDLIIGNIISNELKGGDGSDALYAEGRDSIYEAGDGDYNQVATQLPLDVWEALLAPDGQVDRLWGENGNDYLHGGRGFDLLFGGAGDDILIGGEGDDVLWGGDESSSSGGHDVMIGGAGDDLLLTSDTSAEIRFGAGDGVDLVKTAEGGDYTLKLLSLNPDDITIIAGGEDDYHYYHQNPEYVHYSFVSFEINSTGDKITFVEDDMSVGLVNYPFADWSTLGTDYAALNSPVSEVQFANGITWSASDLWGYIADWEDHPNVVFDVLKIGEGELPGEVYGPEGYLDHINATYFELDPIDAPQATVDGSPGNDWLSDTYANDVITGGLGDDQIFAEYGADTFVWNIGDGNDTVRSFRPNNTLSLGAGITPADLTFSLADGFSDLVISVAGQPGSVTLISQLLESSNGVSNLVFADGTVWTREQLITAADDALQAVYNTVGTSGDDTLYLPPDGFTVTPGQGDDVLMVQGSGSGIISFSKGDGADVLVQQDRGARSDTLHLIDILPSEVQFGMTMYGELEISVTATGDSFLVSSQFWTDVSQGLEFVQFADATVWDRTEIEAAAGATISSIPMSIVSAGDDMEMPSSSAGHGDVQLEVSYLMSADGGAPSREESAVIDGTQLAMSIAAAPAEGGALLSQHWAQMLTEGAARFAGLRPMTEELCAL